MRNKNEENEIRMKITKHEVFKELIKDLKRVFATEEEGMNYFKRVNILFALHSLKYRDDELLDQACDCVLKGKGNNTKNITNLLYLLSKFKYQPDEAFLKKSAEILQTDLAIPVDLVCRNLWNFYSLDHYDPKLFDKFSDIIVKNHD